MVVSKAVIIDEKGEYLFIGYSEKEIKEALENKQAFNTWLEDNGVYQTK